MTVWWRSVAASKSQPSSYLCSHPATSVRGIEGQVSEEAEMRRRQCTHTLAVVEEVDPDSVQYANDSESPANAYET